MTSTFNARRHGLSPRPTRSSAFAVGAVLAFVALAATGGCKSKEQRLRDETLTIHEEAYQILADNKDDPDKAIEKLTRLEEDSRARRAALRKQGLERMKKMSPEELEAFRAESMKRHEKYVEKFNSVMKAYSGNKLKRIRQLLSVITR